MKTPGALALFMGTLILCGGCAQTVNLVSEPYSVQVRNCVLQVYAREDLVTGGDRRMFVKVTSAKSVPAKDPFEHRIHFPGRGGFIAYYNVLSLKLVSDTRVEYVKLLSGRGVPDQGVLDLSPGEPKHGNLSWAWDPPGPTRESIRALPWSVRSYTIIDEGDALNLEMRDNIAGRGKHSFTLRVPKALLRPTKE